MDIKQYFEEYSRLVGRADVEVIKGVTNPEGIEIEFLDLIYNGCISVESYKDKLDSISLILKRAILRGDNVGLVEKNEGHVKYHSIEPLDIRTKILSLKGKFIVDKKENRYQHIQFHIIHSNCRELINQELFRDYIKVGFENVSALETVLKSENIERLILGDEETKRGNREFIDSVLKRSNIVDEFGKCILTSRKKRFIWILIDLLKDSRIITTTATEEMLITTFWAYINGEGNPPQSHRESKAYINEKTDFKFKFFPK